jgi:hypothetical protein
MRDARPRLIGIYSPAPQSGKSTLAQHLARRGYTVVPFARALKRIARCLCYELGLNHEQIETALGGDKSTVVHGDVTMRRVLQTLGTEWGRATLGQDVWVHCWRMHVRSLGPVAVVADDVRFDNEAAAVRALGGETWAVVRPGAAGAGTHASEAGVSRELIDRWLLNDTSVDEFLANADRVLEGCA